jgi:hypothetical protein
MVDSMTGFSSPLSGNTPIESITGFSYGTSDFETLYAADEFLYRDPINPLELRNSLSSSKFSYVPSGNILYMTNGVDPVMYYDPARDTDLVYDAGYDTPGSFTATPGGGGSMANGIYDYYAVLYDFNTETKSNPQSSPVSATVIAGPIGSVALTLLPLDPDSRSTHWIIYRKGPSDFYFYFISKVPYNPLARTFTDTIAAPGRGSVVEFDNFKPDVSDGMFYHVDFKTMVYFKGNVITWAKKYRNQNVPTFNRELLDDNSQVIVAAMPFKKAAVFFKTNSIYVMLGDPGGDYEIKVISTNTGTRSPASVVAKDDGIFFFDSTGKARYITPTDFDSQDLRAGTDISNKYREKFAKIPTIYYNNCFAVMWETAEVTQWRLFVPIDTSDGTCDHCYVYDKIIGDSNGGDSAWFDFKYSMKLNCAAAVESSTTGYQIHAGDSFGLIWRLDIPNQFQDALLSATEWERMEDDTAAIFTDYTVELPGEAFSVNEKTGLEIVFYEPYTYRENFRSRVVSNTADIITVQDKMQADLLAGNYITIGGYMHYFGTSWFTRDHAGRNAADKISLVFDQKYKTQDIQVFVHYDFNEEFNVTNDYINNPSNPNGNYLADNYTVIAGLVASVYGSAIYDSSRYGRASYFRVNFLVVSNYYFNHVSWGVISRRPNRPFGYIGATLYLKSKKDYV